MCLCIYSEKKKNMCQRHFFGWGNMKQGIKKGKVCERKRKRKEEEKKGKIYTK
jgi:hypothetical protein